MYHDTLLSNRYDRNCNIQYGQQLIFAYIAVFFPILFEWYIYLL